MPQGDDGRGQGIGPCQAFIQTFCSAPGAAADVYQVEHQDEFQAKHQVDHEVVRKVGHRPERPASTHQTSPLRAFCVLLLAAALGIGASGCGLKKTQSPKQTEQTTVDLSLGEAANAIMADLARLSGSTQTYGELQGQSPLKMRMDMNFEGPLPEALKQVCAAVGFRLVEKGSENGVPLLVRVRAKDTEALHVLRVIGLQTTARERVLVREPERVIELRWANADEAEDGSKARSSSRSAARDAKAQKARS